MATGGLNVTDFRRLTVWQEMASPHIIPLLSELAPYFDSVRLVTLSDLDSARRAIGWPDMLLTPFEHVHATSLDRRRAAASISSGPHDLNLMQGLKFTRWLWSVQRILFTSRAGIVLISETPWPAAGFAQRVTLGVRERSLARLWSWRAHALLAMGEEAAIHFAKAGFESTKIFPFLYVPELAGAVPSSACEGVPTIVVAATLERHKGIDLLFGALAKISERKWRLRVAGDGELRPLLQRMAIEYGFNDRIDWLGWQPSSAIAQTFADASLLVLPSRYDGWGAVVNEALGVGTPVVVSRGAGAHCLLRDPLIGEVVDPNDANALAAAICRQLDDPVAERREAIRDWSRRAIHPTVVAKYFMACVTGKRPMPPWQAIEVGCS